MAIQFNCPSCGAMIRVPDNAAGKKGTCPQCSEKLLVPDVVPVASGGRQPPDSPVSIGTTARTELPRLEPLAVPTASPAFPDFSNPAAQSAPPDVAPQLGLPPLVVGAADTSIGLGLKTKALKKKRKNQGAWIVPALCVVGLIGVLGWYFWKSQPKLEGQLEAQAVSDLQVEPGLIPGDVSGLSKADLAEVLRHLKAEPARWTSTASRMTLKGTDGGVEVSIDPGTASHFVRVSPAKNPAFLAYITQHAEELDKPRRASIAAHGPKLFAAWKDQFDKHESITDQKSHRDLVALPALVTGVGYHLEAVIRGTAHPCVYEDGDGRVYFLLPNATKSFVLQGRHGVGGLSIPANFQVKLAGTAAAPAARKSSKNKTKEELESENEGMNPDLYKQELEQAKADAKNSRNKKKGQSEGEALKMGLTGMLSGDMPEGTFKDMPDEMTEKPASKSKTSIKAKKPGMMSDEMMKDDETSEEMMDEMPAKSLPKKGTSKIMPKEEMTDEMMEKDGEMPQKPKPAAKPKARTSSE